MRSQSTTEYLIILALVIVIGLIVIIVLGSGTQIADQSRSSDLSLLTSPIGVEDYVLFDQYAVLTIVNNRADRTRINEIEIDNNRCYVPGNLSDSISPGQRVRATCFGSFSVNDNYAYNIRINYTDVVTQAKFIQEYEQNLKGGFAQPQFSIQRVEFADSESATSGCSNPDNLFDGNYVTSAQTTGGGVICEFNEVYGIPNRVINAELLVLAGQASFFSALRCYCLNYSSYEYNLVFYDGIMNGYDNYSIPSSCLAGPSVNNICNFSALIGDVYVYDTAILWNITSS